MPDAVLFELEGVLADTHEPRRDSALDALGACGVNADDAEYESLARGRPTRDAIAALLARHDAPRDETAIDLATADAERRFAQRLAHGATLRPGAAELVRALQGRVRLGIVTRARRREAARLLSLAGLDDAFECVRCAEDAFPPKPAAAPYVAALERLAGRRPIRAERVLALEDSADGARSALGAGVRCLIVGDPSPDRATDAGAHLATLAGQTADSLDALLTLEARPEHG